MSSIDPNRRPSQGGIRPSGTEEMKVPPMSEDAQQCLAIVAHHRQQREDASRKPPLPLTSAPTLEDVPQVVIHHNVLPCLTHREARVLSRSSHHLHNTVVIHAGFKAASETFTALAKQVNFLAGTVRLKSSLLGQEGLRRNDDVAREAFSWTTKIKHAIKGGPLPRASSQKTADEAARLNAQMEAEKALDDYLNNDTGDWKSKVERLMAAGYSPKKSKDLRVCDEILAHLQNGIIDVELVDGERFMTEYLKFDYEQMHVQTRALSFLKSPPVPPGIHGLSLEYAPTLAGVQKMFTDIRHKILEAALLGLNTELKASTRHRKV